MVFAALILSELKRKENIKNKKARNVIGQYRLNSATSGSKPISPIPTTIPMRQMFNFVILSDLFISYIKWQLLQLFSTPSFRNCKLVEHISNSRTN
jgi:hypothetical protein